MSFEGFYQKLCPNGHYTVVDVYRYMEKCPICHQNFVWENLVDMTNGGYDGLVDLQRDIIEFCSECGQVKNETYVIPKDEGRRIDNIQLAHNWD